MNKQQLAAKIWESANNMRSKIEANEYKDYILGFIFYKFLSEKEENLFYEECDNKDEIKELTENDEDYVSYYQNKIGYFISYDNLFSTWIKKGKDFDVSNVSDALSAFNRLIAKQYEKVYEKIFDTLQAGLSKLGDNSGAQTKAIRNLIHLINDIPMDGKQDYDVLGFIYEYLISMFAANAGKKAGEFYTPHEVSLLMSEIVAHHLKDRERIDIYDPTSGSGSLLINIGNAVSKYMRNKDCIKYYAQELKENTFSLTRMNLIMRGILPSNIIARNGDTLNDDWPFFDENDKENTYFPLPIDAVVSNPPYSQKWDPTDRENDPRFRDYGLAPKSKADYAFLLHDLYHLKNDGIMAIVLPHGVLFRGGEEEKIRKNLVERNNIDTIIGLPANIFFGTGIPTIIMVLKKTRVENNILIIDASKGFEKVGKSNRLRKCDIKKIVDTYISRETISGYSKLVDRDEIRKNEYNLNIPRYVDSSDKKENWDLYSTIYGGIPNKDIDDLREFWMTFPSLKDEIFARINSHVSKLKTENLEQTVLNNKDVIMYKNNFSKVFESFKEFLKSVLIDNIKNVNPIFEEENITHEIFRRLENMPLIDKYCAYQLFIDEWPMIANDLEIIKSEGLKAINKVDDIIVIKKHSGKDSEEKDGYVGHILPFDLVQRIKLKNELSKIDKINCDIEKVAERRNELFETFDKDIDNVLNEESTDFDNKSIAKQAKLISKNSKNLTESEKIIIEVNDLYNSEKQLNKDIKLLKKELEEKTKLVIENLSLDESLSLIERKWIEPLFNSIIELPNIVLNSFVKSLIKLSKKYEETLLDLEKQINETENEIISLMSDLTGEEYDMDAIEELQKVLKGDF